MRSHQYDLVVFGGGCAGLSLLTRLVRAGWTKDRKILLVEKDAEKANDRTWCFWEKESGFFEDLVFHKWQQLSFHSDQYSSEFSISPYSYKMIRGMDFYRYCMHQLGEHPEIEIARGFAKDIHVSGDRLNFRLNDEPVQLRCPLVFSSIIPAANEKSITLLQHFKGWMVKTQEPVFSNSAATFMDFRVPQNNGTAFVYVLPVSQTEALVEYTLFSKEILSAGSYTEGLRNYMLGILKTEQYEITAEEFGVIPMTNREFPVYSDGVYYIGTAGGQTKASSGFTFRFIQEQTRNIAEKLLAGEQPPRKTATPSRFRFYDNTLLHILYHEQLPGHEIFAKLFRRNKPGSLLAFLDNKSTIGQELKIISSLPVWPFLKAALHVRMQRGNEKK